MHEAYVQHRSGFLPVAGGVMDQSAGFLFGVSFLAPIYARHEQIEMKRAKNG